MSWRALVAACAFAVPLASSGVALAHMEPEMPFVPTDHDLRPWAAGTNVTPWGFGEISGRAALTGKGRLIVVQRKVANQVFIVGSTKILDARGNRLPASALHEGDVVKVDYDQRGNTAIARRVTILTAPAPLP